MPKCPRLPVLRRSTVDAARQPDDTHIPYAIVLLRGSGDRRLVLCLSDDWSAYLILRVTRYELS